MKLGTLKKICLQYLELSDEINVLKSGVEELEIDDAYKEYANAIEQSIFTGISRIVASCVLVEMKEVNTKVVNITDAYKISEIFSMDTNNKITNEKYLIVGKKALIEDFDSSKEYYCIYHPKCNIDDFVSTEEVEARNDMEIEGIGDEVLVNIKYLVYADMKIDENPTVAIQNRNFFEQYLAETKKNQVVRNQVEIESNNTFVDTYSDSDNFLI